MVGLERLVPHASFQLPEQTFSVQPPKPWDHMHPTQISLFYREAHSAGEEGQPGFSCRQIANHRHQTIEKTDKA